MHCLSHFRFFVFSGVCVCGACMCSVCELVYGVEVRHRQGYEGKWRKLV
jgi:hypothetical protein